MVGHKMFSADEEYEVGQLTMRLLNSTGTRWHVTKAPGHGTRNWYVGNGHTRTCWLHWDEVLPMLRFMDEITRKAYKRGHA